MNKGTDVIRDRLKRVLPLAVIAACAALAFTAFIRSNAARIALQNEEYLDELTVQRAVSIDNLISENETFILSTAYLFAENLEDGTADVEVLRDFEQNSAFDFLRFIDTNGDNHTSEGVMANLSDRDYFQAGMRGESGITYVAKSRVTGQKQIGFYTPVYYDDQIVGVMVGFYGEEFIQRLLAYELFGYEGECWLCARDGTVMGSTRQLPPANYLDYLAAEGRCPANELENLRESFAAGRDANFTYYINGKQASADAVALEQADWMFVRTFPPAATEQITKNANQAGERLLAELLALFGVYVLYLVGSHLVEQRRTAEANRNANDISTGVARLFDIFVRVDLDALTYEYIEGVSGFGDLPTSGDLREITDRILAAIPEDDHRTTVAQTLDTASMRAALADSDRTSMRVHAPNAHGEWHTYNFVVIDRNPDGSAHQLLLIAQDVTSLQQREMEEQERLQEALDVAERASRAKTEFLFNMSHDIRTPMNAIIGYAELAQHEDTTSEQVLKYVRKIDSSSQHLLSLINDILEMSRIESGKMHLETERCDIAEVLDEARSLFSTQMREKGIDFVVDTCSSVTNRWVLCDGNRLDRIVLNLLSNAYKFTPTGGTVTLSLVQAGATPTEASYELHVADTGIGMSPEFAKRIFSAFERERTSTVSGIQGTGLGLAITKSIVDLMGGSIDVITEQGKGTEFVVRLTFPIVEPPASEEEKAVAATEQVDFTGRHLLLTEDNPVNSEIASLILASYGFTIETAANGQEAVNAVASCEPGHFDAVLMDIQMPVMDGYQAARTIRALEDRQRASVPIIAMTANAFAEDVKAALDAGMNGHIAKPLEVDKMISTLQEVLGGRTGTSQSRDQRTLWQ